MRVITITDGINEFGNNLGAVKVGEIYHVIHSEDMTHKLPITNPFKGEWYMFIERPGLHWHGLFREIGWDDDLEEETTNELPEHISRQY